MRVDFDSMEWESPMPGVRHKASIRNGRCLRLVEYSKSMEPHWCHRGHTGYILDGQLEIEFKGGREVYESGDGVTIASGEEHAHRARVLSDVVRAIFVEEP
jgi:hypothetical protein